MDANDLDELQGRSMLDRPSPVFDVAVKALSGAAKVGFSALTSAHIKHERALELGAGNVVQIGEYRFR